MYKIIKLPSSKQKKYIKKREKELKIIKKFFISKIDENDIYFYRF